MNMDTLREGAARAGISADKLKQLIDIFGAEIAAQIVAAQATKAAGMKEIRAAFKEFGDKMAMVAITSEQIDEMATLAGVPSELYSLLWKSFNDEQMYQLLKDTLEAQGKTVSIEAKTQQSDQQRRNDFWKMGQAEKAADKPKTGRNSFWGTRV